MTSEAYIHLRVPRATKGLWVRVSRAAGMGLSDWIIEAVEARMEKMLTTITIPEGVDFSDLHLSREPDGSVSFDIAAIETICRASSIPVELLRDGSEDSVSDLLVAWYQAHIAQGGAHDPVADDLIAEAMIEAAAGQNFSLAPGRGYDRGGCRSEFQSGARSRMMARIPTDNNNPVWVAFREAAAINCLTVHDLSEILGESERTIESWLYGGEEPTWRAVYLLNYTLRLARGSIPRALIRQLARDTARANRWIKKNSDRFQRDKAEYIGERLHYKGQRQYTFCGDLLTIAEIARKSDTPYGRVYARTRSQRPGSDVTSLVLSPSNRGRPKKS